MVASRRPRLREAGRSEPHGPIPDLPRAARADVAGCPGGWQPGPSLPSAGLPGPGATYRLPAADPGAELPTRPSSSSIGKGTPVPASPQ